MTVEWTDYPANSRPIIRTCTVAIDDVQSALRSLADMLDADDGILDLHSLNVELEPHDPDTRGDVGLVVTALLIEAQMDAIYAIHNSHG